MDKRAEFHGWRRSSSGNIVDIVPDADGGLFSAALNLLFRWEDDHTTHVRLLRPYLPDGTPITTSMEVEQLYLEEKELREEAEDRVATETKRRQEAEAELERLRAQLANRQNEMP